MAYQDYQESLAKVLRELLKELSALNDYSATLSFHSSFSLFCQPAHLVYLSGIVETYACPFNNKFNAKNELRNH